MSSPSDPTLPRTPAGASSFRDQVFAMVRRIPLGRISTYGDIAALLGRPRAARGVGWALASLADDGAGGDPGATVPWWRVVNRNGEISSPSLHHVAQRQRALLLAEGIRFDRSGRIDRERYGWWPTGGEGPGRGEEQPCDGNGPGDDEGPGGHDP